MASVASSMGDSTSTVVCDRRRLDPICEEKDSELIGFECIGEAFPEAYKVVQQIVAALKKRPLCPDDINLVDKLKVAIANNLDTLFTERRSTGSNRNWKVNYTPGIKHSLYLYDDENVQIMLNIFDDCTETYIHNHRQAFCSCCIEGGYIHSLWQIQGDTGMHNKFSYVKPGVIECIGTFPGQIKSTMSHLFSPGQVYFLSTYQYHTVKPVADGTITLVVRDSRRLPKSSILFKDDKCKEDVITEGSNAKLTMVKKQSIEKILYRVKNAFKLHVLKK
jgi:hypothetical protein